MGEPPRKDFPPGWNDPPMLSYSTSNPPPKSRITNKRVAFPLGTQSSNESNAKSLDGPPVPFQAMESDSQCVENLFLRASENYNKLLENVNEESIKEQIWQMLSAWQARKLSINVQNMLTDLSNNIVTHNSARVNEIHLQLTMDQSSPVKTYLPAIKYLINYSLK